MILKEVKRRKRNLFVGWIDYKKAFDMVPHTWISECLNMFGINQQICNLIEESIKSWRVELSCGDQSLGEVLIRERYFSRRFIISTPFCHLLDSFDNDSQKNVSRLSL